MSYGFIKIISHETARKLRLCQAAILMSEYFQSCNFSKCEFGLQSTQKFRIETPPRLCDVDTFSK